MNKEIKDEWVRRLREPDRKQAKNYLELEGTGQCCLGVLCEIAHEAGIVDKRNAPTSTRIFYGDSCQELPPEVFKWAGLANLESPANPEIIDGIMHDGMTYNNLAEANDSGVTFSEIADVIEKSL